MPGNSYTTSLFKEGLNKICAKIGEESGGGYQGRNKRNQGVPCFGVWT